MKSHKLPSYLLGKYQLIGTVTFAALFALVFLNIYIPFSETAWFRLGDSMMFLLTLVFASVSILILVVSRLLMYRMKRVFELTYFSYILWCVLEVATVCAFYTWLTMDFIAPDGELAVTVFGRSFLYGAIALGLPYLVSGMYFSIIDKNNTIRMLNYDNVVTDEPLKPETNKITLFDNNYIKVWYSDNKGDIKQYMLRCRLKTVEESFKGSGLVRCHRKYIVNIKKVKVLRKESDGYVLDLDNETIPVLPVTKTYTDIVLSHFTGESPLLDPIDY